MNVQPAPTRPWLFASSSSSVSFPSSPCPNGRSSSFLFAGGLKSSLKHSIAGAASPLEAWLSLREVAKTVLFFLSPPPTQAVSCFSAQRRLFPPRQEIYLCRHNSSSHGPPSSMTSRPHLPTLSSSSHTSCQLSTFGKRESFSPFSVHERITRTVVLREARRMGGEAGGEGSKLCFCCFSFSLHLKHHSTSSLTRLVTSNRIA